MGNERKRLTVLIVVSALTFAGVRWATHYRLQQKRLPDLSVIPYQLDRWSGVDGRFDPVYGADPADTSLLRVYQQGVTPPVIAYVGFFGDLTTILEVHTPEVCYPAQGWTIVRSRKSVAGIFRGARIPAREIIVDKNGNRRLVMWWYNAGPRPFETRIRYVYTLLAISAVTGRTDGSLIRLETPIDADGEAAAGARIEEFQKAFLSQLDRALP